MKKTLIALAMLAAIAAPAHADGIDSPKKFYAFLGVIDYAADACAIPFPEKLVGTLAAKVGVTKKMIKEEGGFDISIGQRIAREASAKRGLKKWCAFERGLIEKEGQ
jgi:hypothetical protein